METRLEQALHIPFAGAPRPHLAEELRVVFYEKYALYYLPRPGEILVVRVLHASRDIVSCLDCSADRSAYGDVTRIFSEIAAS